jgi:hypothetical protein
MDSKSVKVTGFDKDSKKIFEQTGPSNTTMTFNTEIGRPGNI